MKSLNDVIQQKASQCVKCGLCVPHCPTYAQTQQESESPRGRIALMEALARGQLTLTRQLEQHLDHCLNCGACERVCPSEVKYGSLIDTTRAFIRKKSTLPRFTRVLQTFLEHLVTRRFLLRWMMILLSVYQKTGLAKLSKNIIERGHWLHTVATLPPAKIVHWQPFYPAKNNERGRVGLFTGCIATGLDTDTIYAAIHVLTSIGFGVYIPPQQTCCGAIHLHAGNAATHAQLTKQNKAIFATLPINKVITLASGCQAVLTADLHYQDIQAFLLENSWPQTVSLRPLQCHVAVHTPCTAQSSAFTTQLLQRIPGISLQPLTTTASCCGAAGTYLLRHAQMSQKITTRLMETAHLTQVNIVASCNIGCSLQLTSALKQRFSAVSVMHPIQLISNQLILDKK